MQQTGTHELHAQLRASSNLCSSCGPKRRTSNLQVVQRRLDWAVRGKAKVIVNRTHEKMQTYSGSSYPVFSCRRCSLALQNLLRVLGLDSTLCRRTAFPNLLEDDGKGSEVEVYVPGFLKADGYPETAKYESRYLA